jgi:hypothetical protein
VPEHQGREAVIIQHGLAGGQSGLPNSSRSSCGSRYKPLLGHLLTSFVVSVLLTLGLAVPAQAAVYWGNYAPGSIGRANLDGTGVHQEFISPADTGLGGGVAVNSSHIYWAGYWDEDDTRPPATISRSKLDGTNAQHDFIPNARHPTGVVVTSSHIYWANDLGASEAPVISRANLDGTGVQLDFMTQIAASGPHIPYVLSMAVDDSHIYWAVVRNDASSYPTNDGSIARANLDGTGRDLNYIPSAGYPNNVAVDGSHIYWTDATTGRIGRATLDGTSINRNFFVAASQGSGPQPFCTGLALDSAHIYWQPCGTYISRADLDGSHIQHRFIRTRNCCGWPGFTVDQPCSNEIRGTDRNDDLKGTSFSDNVVGLGNHDVLSGGRGNDCLDAGSGDDNLDGKIGKDKVDGGPGNDLVIGGKGNDKLRGRGGTDLLSDGLGHNVFNAGGGADVVSARNSEPDKINCGPGKDHAYVDAHDKVRACETVVRHGPPQPLRGEILRFAASDFGKNDVLYSFGVAQTAYISSHLSILHDNSGKPRVCRIIGVRRLSQACNAYKAVGAVQWSQVVWFMNRAAALGQCGLWFVDDGAYWRGPKIVPAEGPVAGITTNIVGIAPGQTQRVERNDRYIYVTCNG